MARGSAVTPQFHTHVDTKHATYSTESYMSIIIPQWDRCYLVTLRSFGAMRSWQCRPGRPVGIDR